MISLRDLIEELMEIRDRKPYTYWRTKRGAWMGKNRWGATRQFNSPAAARKFMQSSGMGSRTLRQGRPEPKDIPDTAQHKRSDDRADIK